MDKLTRVLVTALLLTALLFFSSSNAFAGWFGPSKKNVTVSYTEETACEQLAYPDAYDGCCRRLCFAIINNANKLLKRTEFQVTGTKEGRSTKYMFQTRHHFANPSTDLIIIPNESRIACLSGYVVRDFSSSGVCGPLHFETSVEDADFE